MLFRIFFAIFIAILALGFYFFPWGGSVDTKYREGTLTSGKGLEDILLRETTLESLIEKMGMGSFSVTASDYGYAYEIGYEKFSNMFFFKIPQRCAKVAGTLRELATIQKNIIAFTQKYPDCKNIGLSSIFVGSRFHGKNSFGHSIGENLFTGSTMGKVDNSRQHDFSASPSILISGSDTWESLSFESGIRLYYSREEGGKESGLIIKGMTIYIPSDTDNSVFEEK